MGLHTLDTGLSWLMSCLLLGEASAQPQACVERRCLGSEEQGPSGLGAWRQPGPPVPPVAVRVRQRASLHLSFPSGKRAGDRFLGLLPGGAWPVPGTG